MPKYKPRRDHLQGQSAPVLTLTLAQINEIVGLPQSAYRHDWWWANEDVTTTTHVQCKAWQAAGYDAEPHLAQRNVTFRKKPTRA